MRIKVEDIRADELSIQRRARDLEPLLQSVGWKVLSELAKEARDERVKVILTPTDKQDEVLSREYIKGVIYGIDFLLSLPIRSIELAKQLSGEKNASSSDSADSSGRPGREFRPDERSEFGDDLGPNARITSDDNLLDT